MKINEELIEEHLKNRFKKIEQISSDNKLANFDKTFNKYRVPVYELVFNPINDRLAMELEDEGITFENGKTEENQEKIELLLWETNKKKNNATLQDILKNGVLEIIVIDLNGVILDGNRRVTILKRILKEQNKYKLSNSEKEAFSNPEVIIIPEKLNKNQIHKYETKLQMSVDPKADYDPINIYLKIQRLLNELPNNLTDKQKYKDVADLMGASYTPNGIEKKDKAFKMMEIYLEFIGAKKKFLLLKGKEDSFLQVSTLYENFEKINFFDDLNKNDDNLRKMLNIFWVLIFANWEGKDFRKLVPSGTKKKKITADSPFIIKECIDDFSSFIKNKNLKKEIVKNQTAGLPARLTAEVVNEITKLKLKTKEIIDGANIYWYIKEADKKIDKILEEFSSIKTNNNIDDKGLNTLYGMKDKIDKLLKGINNED